MNETLEYLQTFARFPFALRRFLKHRSTLDEAKQIVRERMEHREENFLRVIEKSVYGYSRSPYLPLLKMAGCELGDLRARVKQKGIEGALRELRAEGVYVTYEEMKGRKPIVRNNISIPVTARDFDNPFARRDFTMTTSGSTGLASQVNQDFDALADSSAMFAIVLDAHQALQAPVVLWSPFLPGPGFRGVFQPLRNGQSVIKWFAPSGWRDSTYWMRYDLATFYMLFWLGVSGHRIPVPEIVRPDDALIVTRYVAETIKIHQRCLLVTGVSRALRICLAAEQAGLDLTGLIIRVGGEPLTSAKANAMQRVGARLISTYSMTEAGHSLGTNCLNPIDVSDLHFFKDAFALITHEHTVSNLGLTVAAINLTNLLDTAPKLLLNAQIDDYGIVEERACGCELETYGWTTHLRDIRSYSKLVSEGATLLGNDMLKILEQVLPARFGGTPLDYQMIEQEDQNGFTFLSLFIHPRVHIEDESAVAQVILDGLRQTSPMADAARTVWQNARTIQIKRQEPIWTNSGKLLPLRVQRHSKN